MPGVDWIPGISQIKAGIQLITGDVEGAARTTENFCKECPVVSQATSLVQLATGDSDGALETQKRCLGTVNNVANGIPVVGHIKGAVHHIAGDHEGGNQALNAATRTAVVFGSGAAAGLATGGLAAIPAGIAAGGAYDIASTVITEKPQGYIAAYENVKNNPSAGTVFDAVAVHVGDGLAGYSGGQVANKIATNVKVNSLEATRTAKMEQLNQVMFDGEGGAAAGGTSGQAISLGQQINALTREIQTIKVGKPQFWYDPKTNQVVAEPASSSTAVPFSGYVNKNTNKEELQKKIGIICEMQEDGLLSDKYMNETALNKQDASKKITERHDQEPAEVDIDLVYPNVPFRNRDDMRKKLTDLQKKFDKNDQQNKSREEVTGYSWLYVHMPERFNYTGAIKLNNAYQGLMHSFLRHNDQWSDFITSRSFLRARQRISSLDGNLRDIRTEDPTQSVSKRIKVAQRNLQNFTNRQKTEDEEDALVEIQLDIHEFIQDNVTYKNYLGESMNTREKMQVFFKVKDKDGNVKVMVICVSDQLYPSHPLIDHRPIRTITTAYFITWEEYLEALVQKSFQNVP